MDSWRELLLSGDPIVPSGDVLHVVVLLFFVEATKFILYMLLHLCVVGYEVRMCVLHAHPWVCAIGVNAQGVESINAYTVYSSVAFNLYLWLSSFYSSTRQDIGIIRLYEVIPPILKRPVVLSVIELANQFVSEILLDLIVN
jgi:hypothetical protein